MKKNILDTDLTGKVAVVTGAGGVLCSGFAKVLARAGAKVALLDLNEETAGKYAQEIMEEGGVASSGGTAFGKYGEGYIRLSYANSLDNIKIAVDRIAKFVKTL